MFRSVYIVRFFAALLLIVFGLSITPKIYLHNIFAKHIDNNPRRSADKPYQVSTSGYNCDNENLVAESNFVSDQFTFEFPVFSAFTAYLLKDISLSPVTVIYSPLRGPPVNI